MWAPIGTRGRAHPRVLLDLAPLPFGNSGFGRRVFLNRQGRQESIGDTARGLLLSREERGRYFAVVQVVRSIVGVLGEVAQERSKRRIRPRVPLQGPRALALSPGISFTQASPRLPRSLSLALLAFWL